VGASERDEFLRAAWRALVAGRLDARRFVFVDEMGANTSLSPIYGWARGGRRAYFRAPRNRGANLTHPAFEHDLLLGDGSFLGGRGTHHPRGLRSLPLDRVLAPDLRPG
jgi:hypothetical protein